MVYTGSGISCTSSFDSELLLCLLDMAGSFDVTDPQDVITDSLVS